MTTEFTPLTGAIGGGLIGLACALLLVLFGKVAGISGLIKSIFNPLAAASRWKLCFVMGLLLAGVFIQLFAPSC